MQCVGENKEKTAIAIIVVYIKYVNILLHVYNELGFGYSLWKANFIICACYDHRSREHSIVYQLDNAKLCLGGDGIYIYPYSSCANIMSYIIPHHYSLYLHIQIVTTHQFLSQKATDY